MTLRRPLVVINGLQQEIPAGDTLDSSTTSSSGVNKGTVLLDFGSSGNSTVSSTVGGQASIISGSVVSAFLMPATTSDHSADEHIVEELAIMAGNIVAGTGFTIYGKTNNVALRGKYNVGWNWT